MTGNDVIPRPVSDVIRDVMSACEMDGRRDDLGIFLAGLKTEAYIY